MTSILRYDGQRAVEEIHDLIGIGIGPFNLSIAALADDLKGLKAAFFDQKDSFVWHPGLLFPDSILQTSFLKDLVTAVKPTSPHSFLSFLVEKKRFYDYMAGRFEGVSRLEFNEYMAWAASRLDSLNWGEAAVGARLKDDLLELEFASGRTVQSRNLVVGAGPQPFIPEWAAAHMGSHCFLANEYLTRQTNLAGKRVMVIGGGQTGAEITLDLLTSSNTPAQVSWVGMLPRFSPLEEGGFVDQVFTPQYVASFQNWPEENRRAETRSQKLASDGLTPVTVDALYREVYHRKHLQASEESVQLLPGREVFDISSGPDGYVIASRSSLSGEVEAFSADVIILATGFQARMPEFLSDLKPLLDLTESGQPQLDPHYRVAWDGPDGIGIYGLNLGMASHGIVDPQMSMMAWRSAVILNAILGEPHFDLSETRSMIAWPQSRSTILSQPVVFPQHAPEADLRVG